MVSRFGQSVSGVVTGRFDYPVTSGYPGGTRDYSVALVTGELVWAHESRIMFVRSAFL